MKINDIELMREDIALETANIYNHIILFADGAGYDRAKTLRLFEAIFSRLNEEIDPKDYDPLDYSHLS